MPQVFSAPLAADGIKIALNPFLPRGVKSAGQMLAATAVKVEKEFALMASSPVA